MMSNGPGSARRSVQSGTRRISTSSTSSSLKHPDLLEPLALHVPERATERAGLVPDDVGAELAVGPGGVAVLADAVRARRARSRRRRGRPRGPARSAWPATRAGRWWRRPPRLRQREPGPDDRVDDGEGLLVDPLLGLVVADPAPAAVGRDDLGGLEVPGGERGLARARGADEGDQAGLGDVRVMFIGRPPGRTTPSAWAGRGRGRPARSARTGPGSRGDRRRCGPSPRTRPGPLEAVVAVAEPAGGEGLPGGLYSALGVVTTTRPGLACPKTAPSSAGSRPGSTCSITSTSAAASNPLSRSSR